MKRDKQDELLESNYDGIQEYDNDLPYWWRALFYLTIIFAVVYSIYFVAFASRDDERLQKELAALKPIEQMAAPSTTLKKEDLQALAADQNRLALGKTVFQARCAPCHGAEGQGIVGPNLTDEYWLHGSKLDDIRHTIEVGVPEKGMMAWKALLSADEITNVALYINSLHGSNPPNPKAPQGDKASE